MKWYVKAKQLMKDKGINQDHLIGLFEVKTRGAVGHYLSGRREPTIEQIRKLATKIDISLDNLLNENIGINDLKIKLLHSPHIKNISTKLMAFPYCAWHSVSTFLYSDQQNKEYMNMFIEIDKLPVSLTENSFVIEIDGHSFGNHYAKGMQLLIIPVEKPKPSDTVLVTIDKRTTLATYCPIADRLFLEILEKGYPDSLDVTDINPKVHGIVAYSVPKGKYHD